MLVTLAAALALQLAPRPADLVHASEEAAYAEFLRRQAIGAANRWTGERCESATIADVSTISMSTPELPVARERLRLEGCGKISIQNLDVARFEGDPRWKIRDGVPGETRIPLEGQEALFEGLFSRAGEGLVDGCEPVLVDDTFVVANPGNIDFGAAATRTGPTEEPRFGMDMGPDFNADGRFDQTSAWVEVWRLRMCGEDRSTIVVFLPTNDGRLNLRYIPVWEGIRAQGEAYLPRRARPAPAV